MGHCGFLIQTDVASIPVLVVCAVQNECSGRLALHSRVSVKVVLLCRCHNNTCKDCKCNAQHTVFYYFSCIFIYYVREEGRERGREGGERGARVELVSVRTCMEVRGELLEVTFILRCSFQWSDLAVSIFTC